MRGNTRSPSQLAVKELLTFAAVAALCLAITIYVGVTAPADKGVADYLAQGLFSTLCALPTGAAWRSFRRAGKSRA